MFPAIVRQAARAHGDRPLLVGPDGQLVTYADADRVSDEVAAGLARRGVGVGDVVCLALPSRPEYAIAYIASAKLGAVTAGINPSLTPPERAALVDSVGPGVVLATPDLAEGLDAAVVQEVHLTDDVDALLRDVRDVAAVPTTPASEPDHPVAIVFTSGTAGLPRGAVFANRQLAAMVRIDVGMKWGEGGHIIASTQFAHVGVMTKLPAQMRQGTTIHWLERWRPEPVLELTSRLRLPTIGGVAPQVALMLRVDDFDAHDLDSVDTLVVGGGPSSPALVREARERFGAAYLIRYSCTQSGGVGTTTARNAPEEEILETVGRARPGIEVEVRHEDGGLAEVGEVGEVCLRSDTVMEGYWRAPEATAQDLRAGWLHTGDLGHVDDRGCLRIVGRSKEMYIRGGYNVFPVEVEGVLSTHPGVRQVVVVPRPDPVMGEVGVAVIVPRDASRPPTLEDLRRHARPRLAGFKLPAAVRVVDELPVTGMLKIDRRALAAHEREAAIPQS